MTRRYIGQKFLTLIALSLCASSLCWGQRHRGQTEQLYKDLEQAQEMRQPQTIIAKARQLRSLALAQHNALDALMAIVYEAEARSDIGSDDRYAIYYALDSLMGQKWLHDADRSLVAAYSYRATYDYRWGQRRRYPKDREVISPASSPTNPATWSDEQWEQRRAEWRGLALRPRSVATWGQKVAPRYTQRLVGRQTHWASTRASIIFPLLLSGGSTPEVSKALEAYIDRTPMGAERMYASWLHIGAMQTSTAETYRAFVKAYADVPEVLYYLQEALSAFVHREVNPREGVEIIDQFAGKFSPQAFSAERERLERLRRSLLSPVLDYTARSEYIVGHREQRLAVHTQHIDSYTVRLYKATDATKRGKYANKKGLELISETRYQVEPNPKWGASVDTITLGHTSAGLYYVCIEPQYAARAVVQPADQGAVSSHLPYMPYHVTDLYVLSRTNEQGLYAQWLDAKTGSPMKMLPLMVYQGKDSTPRTTDEQGLVMLSRDEERDYYLRSQSERDPLGVSIYADRRYQGEEGNDVRPVSTMLTTDRGLYRPGDSVQISGYLISPYRHIEEARVLSDESIRLTLLDPNAEEVAKVVLETDRYGRYTHTFALPTDRLRGRYLLTVAYNDQNTSIARHYIQVEEYKQPSYSVTIEQPKHRLVLGDTLRLPIQVRDYSGASISGAKVGAEVEIRRYTHRDPYAYYPSASRVLTLSPLETDREGRADLNIHLESLPLERPESVEQPLRVNYQEYDVRLFVTSPTGERVEQGISLSLSLEQPNKLQIDLPKYIERRQVQCDLLCKVYALDGKPYRSTAQYEIEHKGKVIYRGECKTNEPHNLSEQIRHLSSGRYILSASLTLDDGTVLRDRAEFVVYSRRDRRIDVGTTALAAFTPSETYTSTEPPMVYLASGLEDSYVFYDIVIGGKTTKKGMLRPKRHSLEVLPIHLPSEQTEQVFVRLYTVRDARLYEREINLHRVQTDKHLTLRWRTFRDRIRAGSQETWTLQVLHQGKPVRASLCATMYDSALDAIAPLSVTLPHLSPVPMRLDNALSIVTRDATDEAKDGQALYPWSQPLVAFAEDSGEEGAWRAYGSLTAVPIFARSHSGQGKMMVNETTALAADSEASPQAKAIDEDRAGRGDLDVRSDFANTAFFLPKLETNEAGEVSWTFQLPETMTRWRLDLYAHTDRVDVGYQKTYIEGFRELMIKPFLPRFVRPEDEPTLTALVSNQTERTLSGEVAYEVFVPKGGRILYREQIPFSLGSKANTTLRLPIRAEVGLDSIGVRITAATPEYSDGEQHLLPVQSGVQTTIRSEAFALLDTTLHRFSLADLFPSSGVAPSMGTLQLSVESNPLLLALSSLPTPAEGEGQSTIDIATRLYLEGLTHRVADIGGLDEWIRQRIDYLSAGGQGERDSLLVEAVRTTPWGRTLDSQREIDQLKRLGEVIEQARSVDVLSPDLVNALAERQDSQGLWSWYPGMRGNAYTTIYIMRLLVRQRYYYPLGRETRAMQLMLQRGWQALDRLVDEAMKHEQSRQTRASAREGAISPLILDYLYLNALDRSAPRRSGAEARAYFVDRLQRAARTAPLYDLPKIAIVLEPTDRAQSLRLVESLRQHLSRSSVGAFFAEVDRQYGYWWANRSYLLTTETIEALRMLTPQDDQTILALREWLLNQKRATRWESTIATAESLHALLLGTPRDSGLPLASSTLRLERADGSSLALSGANIRHRETFSAESQPRSIEVQTTSGQQAWGVAMVRYDLPTTEVEPFGRDLSAERTYFVRRQEQGRTIFLPLGDQQTLQVGDIVMTRLTIRLDRDMDFVALYDPRLGCAEPRQQKSGYLWSGNAGYYYEPRDRTTNFYFDTLPRGEYILEYEQTVVRSGRFSAPSARLQSVYAPEYVAETGFSGFLRIDDH